MIPDRRTMAKLSPAERLHIRTARDPVTGCWNFQGCLSDAGYGTINIGPGKPNKATHRLAWELSHGEIPKGMHVLHRCDNKRCVNPDHLWLGTQADNMADMRNKGLSGSPGRRLSEEERAAIIADDRTNAVIADYFGTTVNTVSRIKARGLSHRRTKLNAEQVIAIRSDPRPNVVIAETFGVTPGQIGHIKRGRVWQELV